MNRIVVAVVALVVAIVLLGTPPALGKLTETRVRDRVAALDASGVLSAEVKSFDRGWFHSTATIELGLKPAYLAQLAALGRDAGELGQRATIAVDFAHGPIALQNGIHVGWSAMVARLDRAVPGVAELEQQLGVPYLFEFRGHTGLAGGVSFDADVPPMNVPAGQAQFKFSGAVIDGSYAGERLVSNARIDSFEFSSPTGTFVLHDLRAKTNNRILSRYVAPGEAEISIESIAATDPNLGNEPLFAADRLKMTSDATVDAAGALLDMKVTYGADRLRLADNEIGDAALGLALHNLDVATLQKYADATRELAAGPARDPQTVLAALAPHIKRALMAAPSLVLEPVDFKLQGEPFQGRVEITTNPAQLPPGDAIDLEPAALLALVNGNADVRLSKTLARRFATIAAAMQFGADPGVPPEQLQYLAEAQSGLLLATLVSQGMLVEDGELYRVALRYADGALTVNGNALPFGLQ
jgi:uncharacterized protein YdgA (DUF945 family)